MLLVSGEESLEYFPWQRVCIDASSPGAPIFLPSSVHAARGKHFSRKPPSTLYRHAEIDRRRFFSPRFGNRFPRNKDGKGRGERAWNVHGEGEGQRDTSIDARTDDRSRGRAPRLFTSTYIRVALFLTAGDLYFPPGPTTFSPDPGSLSVATIVIKSRVNEPHWIGICAPISSVCFVRATGSDSSHLYARYTRRRPEGTASAALLSPCFRGGAPPRLLNSSDLWIDSSFARDFPRIARIDSSFRRKSRISLVWNGVWKFWREKSMRVCKRKGSFIDVKCRWL